MDYNFRELEEKWQKHWVANETFKTNVDESRPKYYVLDMFPYPSGAGLHVGHPLGYIASDIISRYKRLEGFNVLHPMGFDAFGLPAEQYAIQTGQHPSKTTEENINRYKEQLKKIGFSYDWSREIKTCEPSYYKWTQWIFLELFESYYDKNIQKAAKISELVKHFETKGTLGLNAASNYNEEFSSSEWSSKSTKKKEEILQYYRLAYLAYSDVNWCPALGTVLANDEVKEGKSERGGHPVEKIKMRQWFLRITAYADRLLGDLDTLEWSDSLKEMQRNWIGRSEGAEVDFKIENSESKIKVFTTRPDTIFGATFMVLAPEHDLVESITTADQKEEVDKYLAYVKSRTDVERQQEKKVSGVFTGTYAINPFSGNKMPIYLAEYVLNGYGTGAIMAVPSDDDRDNVFAEKFGIDIIDVIDKAGYPGSTRDDKNGKMINSEFLNGLKVKEAISKMLEEIERKNLGTRKINFRLRDAGFSRQRYWGEPFPIIYKDGVPTPLNASDLPLELPLVDGYEPAGDGKSPIAANKDWVITPEGERETDTMPGYAGSSWYFLRYMDPTNNERFVGEEEEKYWQDVDLYIGGAEHAVGHLMYSRFWQKFLFDMNLVSKIEPFKKLINQGMIQGRSSFVYRIKDTNTFVSYGLKEKYDTTSIHVDISIVKNDVLDVEAFKAWRSEFKTAEFELEDGKYKCGWEVEKMSKSKYNVVNPDELVEDFGADTLRMYEMFLGPLEMHKPWDTNGIEGVHKFLRKFWRLFHNEEQFIVTEETATPDELKVLHKTLKKVHDDFNRYSFNTIVSAFMIAANELTTLKCNKREILEPLVVVLSAYAPHISEELWHKLGKEAGKVSTAAFPMFDEKFLKEDNFEYPISINGKVRAKLSFDLAMAKEDVETAVLADERIEKWVDGKPVRKFILVPGRIINVVV